MLIESLIAAVLCGVIFKGRLKNLSSLMLKHSWLLPLAYGIQWIISSLVSYQGNFNFALSQVFPYLHIGSYFILGVFILYNRSLPGMKWVGLGILLNGIVISLNSGMMPVEGGFLPEEIRSTLLTGDGIHSLITTSTKFSILADRIYLSLPVLGQQLLSIGDIFIDLGAFLLVFMNMKDS